MGRNHKCAGSGKGGKFAAAYHNGKLRKQQDEEKGKRKE